MSFGRTIRRVAVIGAGAAGLVAAKELRAAGIAPEVYEASGTVGGLWVYGERGPAYRSLRTNTSRPVTQFSDFPMPTDLPLFPDRAAVETYLRCYACAFGLREGIHFHHSVQCVTPHDREWEVKVEHEGRVRQERFDAVVVASGIFQHGLLPNIPGLEDFPGTVLHSKDYREPHAFAGQNVLVVGLGSSAVDIANDLVGVARRVFISTRRGAWIAPRIVAGRPLDYRAGRITLRLPEQTRAAYRRRLLAEEYRRMGVEMPAAIWRQAGVPFDPLTAPSVTSDQLLSHLSTGTVTAVPEVIHIAGERVVLRDGRELRPDAIIFATGYEPSYPFLPCALQPWQEGTFGLYRLVFPPPHPTLSFVGLCRAHGPIFPTVEMQARWVAAVYAGRVQLPTIDEMEAEISGRVARQVARHDSVIRVPLLPYLDELASIIGARPNLFHHPDLILSLLAGPPVSAQYRLEGPGAWNGAADTIRAAQMY